MQDRRLLWMRKASGWLSVVAFVTAASSLVFELDAVAYASAVIGMLSLAAWAWLRQHLELLRTVRHTFGDDPRCERDIYDDGPG